MSLQMSSSIDSLEFKATHALNVDPVIGHANSLQKTEVDLLLENMSPLGAYMREEGRIRKHHPPPIEVSITREQGREERGGEGDMQSVQTPPTGEREGDMLAEIQKDSQRGWNRGGNRFDLIARGDVTDVNFGTEDSAKNFVPNNGLSTPCDDRRSNGNNARNGFRPMQRHASGVSGYVLVVRFRWTFFVWFIVGPMIMYTLLLNSSDLKTGRCSVRQG